MPQSPISPLLQPYFHDLSPVPSGFMSTFSLSCDRFNAEPDVDMDVDHPPSNDIPPGFYADCGEEVDENFPPGGNHNVRNKYIPETLCVMCAYYFKLNGILIICYIYMMLTLLFVGWICDKSGNDILPDAPPPCDSDKGPDNWTPYDNCLQFEVADFLFC